MAEECTHQCSSCGVAGCGDRTAEEEPQRIARSNIKHVIGVVSGKGGVGKSLVTGALANALRKRGLKVGILDADITGPSIPRQFGVTGQITADEDGINPLETASGIRVMSTNLLLPTDDTPVAWRGPVISGILSQFWGETNWEDIDVLLVDMPPGTSDVFLTVFQSFPVDGAIMVSAPQELVAMIVGKAVNLARNMEMPVLGLVENMAYFECDGCGKRHYLYGEPQGEAIAAKYRIPAHAELPVNPQFAKLCDEGRIEELDLSDELAPIIAQIEQAIAFNG